MRGPSVVTSGRARTGNGLVSNRESSSWLLGATVCVLKARNCFATIFTSVETAPRPVSARVASGARLAAVVLRVACAV